MKDSNNLVGALLIVGVFSIFANSANAESIANTVIEAPEITKEQAIIEEYRNAKSLSDQDLKKVLWAVGFRNESLKMAWSISKAESNGRPLAHNNNTKTGDNSYGIFQINMIGELGPDRREKFKLFTNADLFDPIKNAQIAFHMTAGGSDWSAWKNGQSARVKMFLSEYPSV